MPDPEVRCTLCAAIGHPSVQCPDYNYPVCEPETLTPGLPLLPEDTAAIDPIEECTPTPTAPTPNAVDVHDMVAAYLLDVQAAHDWQMDIDHDTPFCAHCGVECFWLTQCPMRRHEDLRSKPFRIHRRKSSKTKSKKAKRVKKDKTKKAKKTKK